MNHYDLTEEAAEDIRKIARYTLKAWVTFRAIPQDSKPSVSLLTER